MLTREELTDLFPLRVVVDSCVSPHVNKWLRPLVEAALDGYVQLIWSPLIIAESNRASTWLWIKRRDGDTSARAWRQCSAVAKKSFLYLTQVFRVVDDRPPSEPGWTDDVSDAWDLPIWSAAVRSEAAFVVTENLEDGPHENDHGFRIYDDVWFMHPDHFLNLLEALAEVRTALGLAEKSGSTQLAVGEVVATDEAWTEVPEVFRSFLLDVLARKTG